MENFKYSQRSNIKTHKEEWFRREYANSWKTNVEVYEDALDRAAALA